MLLFRKQLDYDIFNERMSNFMNVNYITNIMPEIEITENSEINKPWNAGLKGQQTAWNKGLTKSDARVLKYCTPITDATKSKISEKLKGHAVSEESRQKMSAKKIGKSPWNKGLKLNFVNAKTVKVTNGTLIFDTVKAAADHENVTSSAIIGRIKRSSGWYYVNTN